jgi:hypothetical protein
MLWLSGEPLGPYWRSMGVKICEMPRRLGTPGHKVWGLACGLGMEGHKVWFCNTDWGVLWTGKVRAHWGRLVLAVLFGLWGGGGVNSQLEIKILRLRIYGYMGK